VYPGKKEEGGAGKRCAILHPLLTNIEEWSESRPVRVKRDDALDAAVAALTAFKRRSEKMEETMAALYAEGLSTHDFSRALGDFWGDTGLSRSSVSRANKSLYEAFGQWRKRDLSGEDVLYLFLDGVYLKMRIGNSAAEAVLVAHGVTRAGKRVLFGVVLGGRESEESWKALLLDMEERGLKPPALVVTDGNPGLIKALKTTWKGVPRQRCIAHKIRNVLSRLPKKQQAEVKQAMRKIFYARICVRRLKRSGHSRRSAARPSPRHAAFWRRISLTT